MNIIGISAFYHDSAACLVRDGRIAAAAQEERFTRKKHDQRFPIEAVKACLNKEGLALSDIDLVAFYEKPFLKFERILETYMAYAPRGIASFLKAVPLWVKRKLWIKSLIQERLQYNGKIVFPEHHMSHAASAFFPSPFEEAAFLTIDGVGEWTTTSYGIGKGNEVDILASIPFPHSLGLLYSAFTYYTGFKVNSAEYKVMGLAPYGEPKFKDLILEHLVDIKDDGSFHLNMEYFDYCAGLTMTNSKFHELFGGNPRKPESELTRREMDLACSVQEVTEDAVLRMAAHIAKETGMRKLCLAGGVALNCVSNGKLLRKGIFDDIWIQPASGDAGGALGAALFASHVYQGNTRTVIGSSDLQAGSLLGPEFNNDEILKFLTQHKIPYKMYDDEELFAIVSDLIAEENVVGWFQGAMEFGPRALGCRSIIGDARSPRMQETMNLKIKFRESFRPFAPSVLEDSVADYFDLDRASPYMLLVADVKESRRTKMKEEHAALDGIERLSVQRSDIPAITHVDYSARVQTVNSEVNPRYYRLISEFNRKHGYSVIINTSFNVRGEPIVNTPENAYVCFMRTNMDYLVFGNYVLDKKDQVPLEDDHDWREEFELD